ncbi:MAG: hypothetical protein JXR11_00790 [Balneola sp.]
MVKLILLTIFWAFPWFCWAQNFASEDFVVTQFGLDDGLPQSSVNDIIQTQDGYIWLATYGGLVRFDGLTFTTFNRGNTPGMQWDRIMRLFEDSKGGIWMNTEETDPDFYRFKDGKVEKYSINKRVSSFAQMYNSKEGELWLSAFKTLYKFNGESFVEFPITEASSESELRVNGGETRVLVGNRIISLKNNKAYELISLEGKIEGGIIETQESALYPNALFIGTRSGRFYKFENNKITELNVETGLKGHSFINFGNSNSINKKIYAVIFERIGLVEDSVVKYFNPVMPKKKVSFKSVLEDNEGNTWMGTNANGLFKLQPTAIEMIDQDQGLTTESMLSLTKLNNGTGLFSSNCGGLFEWRGGSVYPSKIQEFYLSGCNWSIFQDSKNQIWIGGNGVYMTNSLNEEGQFFGAEQGFTDAGVYAMMEDRNKNLWVASSDGLYVYDGESFFEKYTETEGLYYRDARVLYEDDSGLIWVGSSAGLNTIRNNSVQKIPLIEIDRNTSNNSQPYVRAIYQDVNRNMWIGTYGEGLFRIKGDSIQQVTVNDGLYDNIVSHIVEDEYGFFWMGSNRGISRIKRNDLNDYLDGKKDNFIVYSFGANDGMNSAETNGGFHPSTFTDEDGKIYFPTVSGVAVVDPDKVSKNTYLNPVYIEGLRSEESQLLKSDKITLSHDNGFLEISYTGINFTDPKKVEFRYKMNGLDDDWIEVGNSRSAIYSKIPPGNYTFQVEATNIDGVWDSKGDSIDITVVPPFWQTAWFYGILVLFISGAGYSGFRSRMRKFELENERQKRFTEQLIESQESERRRIASELHDGLGQQILVIKNRVELAKNQVNDPKQITEELMHITKSAENSIQDVRNISHALRPVHLERFGLTEALNNLAEQLQNSTQIEWSYHVDNIDSTIAKDKEINFYRVIQEATNNILKHSNASEATVIVKKRANSVKATIWDDGRGFVEKQKEISSLGFLGMQERIETLKGTLNIQSRLMEGTTIKIVIPVISYEKKD